MTTKIYGASDDLIDVEGDVHDEFGSFDSNSIVGCSDGTRLEFEYLMGGLWKIKIHNTGDLFDRLEICEKETDKGHSDIAHFKSGLKWVVCTKVG
jgi:hypothetical protein